MHGRDDDLATHVQGKLKYMRQPFIEELLDKGVTGKTLVHKGQKN